MFQTKFVQKIKRHILCPVTFFRKSWHLWDNVEKMLQPETANDKTIWSICVAFWTRQATRAQAHAHAHVSGHTYARKRAHAHTSYTLLFPPQQWFRERASLLRYTYIASLVVCYLFYGIFPSLSGLPGNPDKPSPRIQRMTKELMYNDTFTAS